VIKYISFLFFLFLTITLFGQEVTVQNPKVVSSSTATDTLKRSN